jgi:very-short-patch-repair endonuclease
MIYGKYEIDIMLPKEGVAIEIDGPHHHSPIFGEDRLLRTRDLDQIKNGVLIANGLKIIRIKYTAKKFNNSVGRRMWEAFEKTMQSPLEKLTYVEF